MRLSEPCNRGALKTAHRAFVFLNELTGTQEQDQAGSEVPRDNVKGIGEGRDGSTHAAVPPSVRLVDVGAELGHTTLFRPPRHQSEHSQHHWICLVSSSFQVKDNRGGQVSWIASTDNCLVLLPC